MAIITLRTWLEQHFHVERWRGDEADLHCPLHPDTHASASINTDKWIWKCQGCGAGGKLSDLAKQLGLDDLPPFPGNGQGKLEFARYDYRDAEGKVLYQVVRFAPKVFRQFNPATNEWSVKGLPRLPYRLPELLAGIKAGKVVWIVEGEKDVQSLVKLGLVATCNQGGVGSARLWRDLSKFFPAGTRVVLCPDADKPGLRLMAEVARELLRAGCKVKQIDLGFPLLEAHGSDVSDWLAAGHKAKELVSLAGKAAILTAAPQVLEGAEPETQSKPKQADLAIQLASSVELFHDDEKAYARIIVGDHKETWRLRGREFKTWLRRQFYLSTETAIGSQALDDALGVLEGKALFEGPQVKTYVRIAGDDRAIYVDLGKPRWQVLEIDAEGWRVLDEAPMRFRRPPGMGELPIPQTGGRLDTQLESFLNMEPDDRKLFIACLVNAFRPTGPYPVLCLHGEQGSAKSTAAKIFRGCIDPNTAMLRSTPREERDLLIAGTNGWVVAFDNLSHLPTWVNDALCRVATGAGFGVRELYADDAEVLFQVQRPVVLNGIEDIAHRGDLLDRSVLVYMPPIDEKNRMTERNFMAQFEEALPMILGALLDAVSGAIRNLPEVKLNSVPRMADFCYWIVAAESSLGWEPGSFLQIYRRNREDANSLALEANPIVPELVKLLAVGSWEGTASELHETLSSQVSESKRKSHAWPKGGRATSASLKRLAPNLRAVGIDVEWDRESGGTRTRIIRLKVKSSVFASPCVPIVPKSGTQRTQRTQERNPTVLV